ncbi:MAG: histidine phosphatase family protein [Chloroflexota bacterium]
MTDQIPPEAIQQTPPDAGRAARIPGVFDVAFLTGVEGVAEVILVRHGQPHVNFEGAIGDTIDPPLSDHGLMQAKLAADALSTLHIDAVFASPLKRAYQTGEAIAKQHKGLEVKVIPDLREVEVFRDVPPEKTVMEFLGKELLTGIRQRMIEERNWDVYPYSEPSHDFKKRTINAIEMAIAHNAGHRIVIACHGGVINAYTGHIIGSRYDMFFRPAHASISIVAVGEGRRIVRLLNDTHHLTTGEGEFTTY